MYPTPYSYQNMYQNYNQPHTNQQIVKVHGRNGADTFQMAPNSSALLLDESEPIVYLAQTDGAGYKTISAYDISPHKEVSIMNMQDLEQRIARLEERLNEPDTTNTKSGKYEQTKSNGSNTQSNK